MKQTRAIILTLVIMALAVVGLYACGGDSSTPTPAPTATLSSPPTATTAPATATTAAVSAATSTTSSGTSGTGGTGGSSSDNALIQQAVSSVNTLTSYHFVLDIAASDYVTQPVHAEGDYVAPNTTYVKGTVGNQPFEEVVIGDHLFQKDAGGNWTETQKQASDSATGLFNPQDITSSGNPLGGIDSMFTDIKTFTNEGTDNVNGTSVNKYGFKLDIAEMMAAQGQDLSSSGLDLSQIGDLGGGTLYIDPSAKNLHKLDVTINIGPFMNLIAQAFAGIGGTPTPGGAAPSPVPALPVHMTMVISNHNNDTLPVQLTDAMKQAQQESLTTPTAESVPPAIPTASDQSTPSTSGGTGTGSTGGQVVSGNIGEPITMGDVVLTVNSVDRTTDGNLPPAQGNEYVILNVTVENKGTSDLTLSGLLSFGLTDSAGKDQNYAIGAKYTNMFDTVVQGTIKAGSKATGQLGYEVKQGDKDLTLKFTPNILSSDSYATVKIDQ